MIDYAPVLDGLMARGTADDARIEGRTLPDVLERTVFRPAGTGGPRAAQAAARRGRGWWVMMRLLREPLVHFLVLGAAIFLLFGALDDTPAPPPVARLEVTASDAARLVSQFEATWRRPPTPDELEGLIDQYIREEVLVREARTLGLDQGDAVIRQRLAQKMLFLTESAADAIDPSEIDLAEHLESHRERFETPARVAFEQVRLRPETPADVVLAAVREGTVPDDLVEGSMLPEQVPPSTEAMIDGTFGRGFYAEIKGFEPGVWAGPVDSAFGRHLVRLGSVVPKRLPPLEEIRAALEEDWRKELGRHLAEERLAALTAGYEVVRPAPEAVLAR
ncbi:peptidyl-prolyl cis-trans isomerase [Acuticoccus sediminis]|uniref:peptidylprolyl isomerase n=1 Tax=Acuticoccus sediminis TaxID=2184697 RepID=UPI001CFD3EBE|nr:peptidylprolyl isomerase [Acuticoccus sediminis]